jgi:hypothetical protein
VEFITIGCPKPDPEAVAYFKAKIERYCHKTDVVMVVDEQLPFTVAPTLIWDDQHIELMENYTARFRTTGDTLVIRVLYLAGLYIHDPVTRGLAYGEYAFALFRNTFVAQHERAILLHEFGHLIGLVNGGTPMKSEHAETDPKHKQHCRNEGQCVMYWCAPTIPEPDFDLPCKQDIAANGGKE